MLQGLPLGYQRDLQEDKEPAFDALATLLGVAQALRGAVATLRIDTAAMRAACADPGLYATDVAEALVKTGVPFREAHRRTGELLKRLDADGQDRCATSPRRSGRRSAFRRAVRCSTPTPRSRRAPVPAARRPRASCVSATRSTRLLGPQPP